MMAEYWRSPAHAYDDGVAMELRARIALTLIERWGMVAGLTEGEDSAGRARKRLQTSEELVDRALAVADRFVDTVEARGLLRLPAEAETVMKYAGRLEGLRESERWNHIRQDRTSRGD